MVHFKNTSYIILLTSYLLFSSCSISKQISRSAQNVIKDSALQTAHVGISIYDPAADKFLYNYNGDKYFVPASNIKIPTCYAAMKYLGDSLVGLRVGIPEEKGIKEKLRIIKPTGDPSFMLNEFSNQPVWDFFKKTNSLNQELAYCFNKLNWNEYNGFGENNGLGKGWSWDDYMEPYMAEHNEFPIYGNVINLSLADTSERIIMDTIFYGQKNYRLFKTENKYFDSIVNREIRFASTDIKKENPYVKLLREFSSNKFYAWKSEKPFIEQKIPFITYSFSTTLDILSNTLKTSFCFADKLNDSLNKYALECENGDINFIHIKNWYPIHSQPTDSVLKPMMHRSDNFFAEQSLLMVSNELLGYMNDEAIIDTLLKTDFKDLPQKPSWVDGSGLSRYNLFSPQDFVFILNKMKTEFGMERIKEILPTGGEGTITNYYINEKDMIFGKTGTLSGVVAFSGFLYTKKGRLLIFSTLVNNHNNSATAVRRAVEKFLEDLRKKM